MFGIHAVKPGVLAFFEVHDGETREIIYEPSLEEIEKLCDAFDLDYKFIENVILTRDPGTYAIVVDARTHRKSRGE